MGHSKELLACSDTVAIIFFLLSLCPKCRMIGRKRKMNYISQIGDSGPNWCKAAKGVREHLMGWMVE